MGAKFEVVSKYKNAGINIPIRKTENSAGYDLEVAEDTLLISYSRQMSSLLNVVNPINNLTLEEVEKLTKKYNIKPTLVSTGLKCKLDPNTYLELSVRSSTPLKYWIILANSVGRLIF